MKEISVALVAIALVLSAVFLPMAFSAVDGRDLPPVLADHRGGHGAFGDGGADPVARADRDRAQAPRG
jgi:hypothetical protein